MLRRFAVDLSTGQKMEDKTCLSHLIMKNYSTAEE